MAAHANDMIPSLACANLAQLLERLEFASQGARVGPITYDIPYPNDTLKVEWTPGAGAALLRMSHRSWLLHAGWTAPDASEIALTLLPQLFADLEELRKGRHALTAKAWAFIGNVIESVTRTNGQLPWLSTGASCLHQRLMLSVSAEGVHAQHASLTVNHNTLSLFAKLAASEPARLLTYDGSQGVLPILQDANPVTSRSWKVVRAETGLILQLSEWQDSKLTLPFTIVLSCEHEMGCEHTSWYAYSLAKAPVVHDGTESWSDYTARRRNAMARVSNAHRSAI